METFKCLIIDDEPGAINILRRSLDVIYSNMEIVGAYTQWSKAMEAIRTTSFDILFLDINMQGRNGMELLKVVPGFEAEVIFVTAYSEHAIAAFQVQAAGYLLKPVSESQLVMTVDRAMEHIRNKRLADGRTAHLSLAVKNKIGIPMQQGIEYVDTNDIIYCESASAYTKVITQQGTILCSYNLGKFKTALDKNIFFQPHRSYVINLDHVRRYNTAGAVVMDNDVEIPIARDLRESFQNQFSRINSKS